MKEFPGRAPERAAVEVKPVFSQPAAAEQVDVQAPAASAAAQPVLSEERAGASDARKAAGIFLSSLRLLHPEAQQKTPSLMCFPK